MKSIAAVVLIFFCTGASAAEPGEGDCSSQFLHNFTHVQTCTEAGSCVARKTTTIDLTGILSCGKPWGQIFRVCFTSGGCIDGKPTVRTTVDGDALFTSILNNPNGLGAYPIKFEAVMSVSTNAFPNQLVLFVANAKPYTELLFGEPGSVGFVAQALKSKDKARMSAFLAKPTETEDFKE